jgi:hypothetical protein
MVSRATIASLAATFAVSGVRAHYSFSAVTLGGTTYDGWNNCYWAGSDNATDPVRQANCNNPYQDITSSGLTCNTGTPTTVTIDGTAGLYGGVASAPAPLDVTVAAGSDVTIMWSSMEHPGPITTWMAKCDGPCSEWTGQSTEAVWFKIDEYGFENGEWANTVAQANLVNGLPSWTVTIPSTIVAGNYLIRQEQVGLHISTTPYGAQFFVGCAQLVVTGGGSDDPSTTEGYQIPGIYDVNSFLYPDWDTADYTSSYPGYVIPGPGLWSGASSASGAVASAPAATATAATGATTAAAATSSAAAVVSTTAAAATTTAAAVSSEVDTTVVDAASSSSAAAIVPPVTTSAASAPVSSSGAKTCSSKRRNKKRMA